MLILSTPRDEIKSDRNRFKYLLSVASSLKLLIRIFLFVGVENCF